MRYTAGRRVPASRWDEVWDRYVAESLGHIRDENDRRQYARFYAADLPLPDSTPVIGALVADAAGNLWADRYRLPWEEKAVWDVLGPDGTWLGTVTLPEPVELFDTGEDYLLARHTDTLGVERLVVYKLEKP